MDLADLLEENGEITELYDAAQPTSPATVSIVARESVSTSPCLLATRMKVPYKVGRVQVKVRAEISEQAHFEM